MSIFTGLNCQHFHRAAIGRSISRRAILLAIIIALQTAAQLWAATAEPQFVKPDRIRYDSHCLTIDGKDTLIYSGAFHYFRCPKELWRERFAKIKEAGFNTVETYIAWNCA